MIHGIFKSLRLPGFILASILILTLQAAPIQAFADNNNDNPTPPSTLQSVTQYCAGKSGPARQACNQGYSTGAAGAGHQSVSVACGTYDGANLSDAQQQLLYDCQSAWGYTAGEDPAVFCSPGKCDLIAAYINPAIDLFSLSFGLIAVISLILGGIQYTSSQGDPQKTAAAKDRISKTLMAVFIYLFLFSFLQFLIPGGIFH